MTFEEFRQLVNHLHQAYPSKQLTAATAEMWFRQLEGCDYLQVKRRLDFHIKQHKFLPCVSQLYVKREGETTVLHMLGKWEKEGAERIEHDERNQWNRSEPPWKR
jgi:hypothetical protein